MNDKNQAQIHSLNLENRKVLTLSGVLEVESSNEKLVLLKTSAGRLKISGTSISIGMLNVETGQLSLSGNIDSLEYKTDKKSSSLSSLFK